MRPYSIFSSLALSFTVYGIAFGSNRHVRRCQEKFLKGQELNTEDQLFGSQESFSAHTPDLFRLMSDPDQVHDFFEFGQKHKLLGEINDRDLKVAHDEVFKIIGCYLQEIRPNAFKNTRKNSIKIMIENLQMGSFGHIPIEVIKKHGDTILETQPEIHYYMPAQIREFVDNPAWCQLIDGTSLNSMNKDQWKEFTAKCLALTSKLNGANLCDSMENIPTDMFKYVIGPLSKETVKCLTSEHVFYFASETSSNDNLGYLDIYFLNKNAASGVTSTMFLSFFKRIRHEYPELKKTRWLKLGKKWENFSDNLFQTDEITNYLSMIASSLSPKDTRYLKVSHLTSLVSHSPKVCAYLPHLSCIRSTIDEIMIPATCFANLSTDNQVYLLTLGAKLPPFILARIGARHVEKWPAGLLFLNNIRVSNEQDIIAKMGVSLKKRSLHACRLIDSVSTLKKLVAFRKAIPRFCWESLGFKITNEYILKYPMLFAGRKNILKTILSKNEAAQFINKATSEQLVHLTRDNGDECQFMTLQSFRMIPLASVSGLSPACIARLPFKSSILPNEIFALDDRAFSAIDKDTMEGFRLKSMRNQQISWLSADVEDNQLASLSPAFNMGALEELGQHRLKYLPGRIWKMADPSLFAIFKNPKEFDAFPAIHMIYWRADQIKVLPKKLLFSLHDDQVTHLGRESQDLQEIEDFIAPLLPNFSEPARQMIAFRFSGIRNDASHQGWSSLLKFAILFCAISSILI